MTPLRPSLQATLDSGLADRQKPSALGHIMTRQAEREALEPTVSETLQSRDTTHGHYPYVAQTIRDLKDVAEEALERAHSHNPKKPAMTPAQREGLDMILHKIGRILNGDPNTADHWHDIAGYATLNSNLITKGTHL